MNYGDPYWSWKLTSNRSYKISKYKWTGGIKDLKREGNKIVYKSRKEAVEDVEKFVRDLKKSLRG